jgi:hypothetical protein
MTLKQKKCEALISNEGRSWSIVLLPGDEKKYHQCNQPAAVHVNNPEVGNHGAPDKVWLCSACDELSATKC